MRLFDRIADFKDRLLGRKVLYSTHFEEGNRFTDDFGNVLVHVHPESDDCHTYGCTIHAPTPQARSIGKQLWAHDKMQRVCEHGFEHPDPDGATWQQRTFGEATTAHECDGCCHRAYAELMPGHVHPPLNRARCRKCGDVIVSRFRHDFVMCECGSIAVDGGNDYMRRVGDPADFEELP